MHGEVDTHGLTGPVQVYGLPVVLGSVGVVNIAEARDGCAGSLGILPQG